METPTASSRAKRDGRNGYRSTRKEFPVRFNLLSLVVLVFTCLLILKVIVSGLYLRLGPFQLTSPDIALAEEETDQKPGPQIAERERLLKKKEGELKEREEFLKKREQELQPLKQEIETKLEELNTLQTQLTAFAKQLAEREAALKDTKITHLVSLYSAMEPGKAATIMEKLNPDTIVLILRNMKGKSAGQILAMMQPEKGAMISEKLSKLD